MEEQIDIYNDRYEYVGVAGKKEAHKKGLWHRSFLCLLINPNRATVLLQRKIANLYEFDRPDYCDFTVGGHYQAGEGLEGGVREIQEEVGLSVSSDDLVPIGVRQTAHTITDTFVENEFQHMYLLPIRRTIRDFTLDLTEVQGLVEINVQDGIDLCLGKTESISAEAFTMRADGKKYETIQLSRKDFVPSYLSKDKIFLKLFIAAKRYFEGAPPEEIVV